MPDANNEACSDFFLRNGLDSADKSACVSLVGRRLPGFRIRPLDGQGGCSYTLICVDSKDKKRRRIVQFRLREYALSEKMSMDARTVYGRLAPEPLWSEYMIAKGRTLQVCAMGVVDGVRIEDVLPKARRVLKKWEQENLTRALKGLARFFALGWREGSDPSRQRKMNGKIGSSVRQRLDMIRDGLPTLQMRREAARVLEEVKKGQLDILPVVLSHGDLLPSNVMVDPQSWELQGLVDWAEAENLPFGVSLYGIEHLLGFMEDGQFVWYQQVKTLREGFWTHLVEDIPALGRDDICKAALLARDIGVLLWHGIAWDDGKLDRVVDPAIDAEESAYLEAFLGVSNARRGSKL